MIYINFVRFWLLFIVVLQPFHDKVIKVFQLWSSSGARIVGRLDEITIALFFLLALREYYVKKYPPQIHLLWFIPVLIFTGSGVVSAIINGNTFLGTTHALFLYGRNFLCIFIYSAFFRNEEDFKKAFRVVLTAGVVLASVAFFQELIAIIHKYVPGIKLDDSFSFVGFQDMQNKWRLGIYRTSSFIGHYNLFGLYMLLLFTVYINYLKRFNMALFSVLCAGVLLSVSRGVFVGFVAVVACYLIKRRNWKIFIMIIPLIGVLLFSLTPYSRFDLSSDQKNRGQITYREYTRQKALTIWKDRPIWGVGPGMFGWGIAEKYNSHIYEEYNFHNDMSRKDLDQFWPQIMAEGGIAGTVAYGSILLWLFIMFVYLSRSAIPEEKKRLFAGFAIFIFALLAYSFTSNFEISPVMYTYFALVGLGIGGLVTSDIFGMQTGKILSRE